MEKMSIQKILQLVLGGSALLLGVFAILFAGNVIANAVANWLWIILLVGLVGIIAEVIIYFTVPQARQYYKWILIFFGVITLVALVAMLIANGEVLFAAFGANWFPLLVILLNFALVGLLIACLVLENKKQPVKK